MARSGISSSELPEVNQSYMLGGLWTNMCRAAAAVAGWLEGVASRGTAFSLSCCSRMAHLPCFFPRFVTVPT